MLKTKATKRPLDLQVQLTVAFFGCSCFVCFFSVILDENLSHLTVLTVRLKGRDKTCSQVVVMLLMLNASFLLFLF